MASSVGTAGVTGAGFRSIDDRAHAELRRRMVFDGAKWDPQVGDVEVIGRQALLLPASTCAALSAAAEGLAREALVLERALLARPDLYPLLGVPHGLRGPLQRCRARSGDNDLRVMRIDFHPTTEGWIASEVNCDVPGGFAEGGLMPRLVAEISGLGRPGIDPARALAAALRRRLRPGARVAMVHATSYSDDRQVMEHLGRALGSEGMVASFVAPDHLRWASGSARSIALGAEGEVDAAVRFFPAEWLPALPAGCGWQAMFGSGVPQCNPPSALLVQTKRAALAIPALDLDLPAWRRWFPAARAPSLAGVFADDWILKPAWGRVGECVAVPGCVDRAELRRMRLDALVRRRDWVLQRRFASVGIASDEGPLHVCVGVFVIDGRAAGYYGRAAPRPRIDKHAFDVAVLEQ